ncbi:MAG: peptidoglycan -binding protein [Rhodospirillaceae bacterium]
MATLGSSRRGRSPFDIWPGFVDALATLLIIIIFVLMVFVLAQFFLGQALSGRDQALEQLRTEISRLQDQMGRELNNIADLKLELAQANSQLLAANARIEALSGQVRAGADTNRMLDRMQQTLIIANEKALKAEEQAQAAQAQIALSQAQAEEAEARAVQLLADIAALEALKAELEEEIRRRDLTLSDQDDRLQDSLSRLKEEQELSAEARAQVALLRQQIASFELEIARLNDVLEASEQANAEKDVQIANLGERLNAALATKVQELRRYRSEFFGRLRDILGGRDDIRIEGDRFVFQSEVLFSSGSDRLQAGGQETLASLAQTLLEISEAIPGDIDWILRIDGHTDKQPISTSAFRSNWDLSAARAISVVEFLIEQGVPAERLAAAGFGEFQPIVDGESEEDFAKNRRIEMKLDQR